METPEIPVAQAGAIDFQLHTLGWKEFQNLCHAVTSEILGQTVQRFLDSHDGGRDGAFTGPWNPELGLGGVAGSYTIQCKFTNQAGATLVLSDLDDELPKASRLGKMGLASNYVLITNFGVSGITDEALRRAFGGLEGIEHVAVFGRDWLTQKIRESARLRMLVPRVYGLGDLSQILDERQYSQTMEIFRSLRDDLRTFVVTDSYRRSVAAISQHGFVLLLGQPASGKSTIGAHLAIGSIDRWKSRPMRLTHPSEIARHWNPKDPQQFFWVDDAFGVTQYQRETSNAWNSQFPLINAALRLGGRFLLTSRDYIYRAAMNDLKLDAFPLMADSQVVIDVEQLTTAEREQILYNHIKMGDQPQPFRRRIKPLLRQIASGPAFLPETARRLGNHRFTVGLSMDTASLLAFAERPVDFLAGVIRTLDTDSRAALGLVFMAGGNLPSPSHLENDQLQALGLMGGSIGGLRVALSSLNGSLLREIDEEGGQVWSLRHPTIGEAIATLIRDDPSLLDVYLGGASPQRIQAEVTCGQVGLKGVQLVIPPSHYGKVLERLSESPDRRGLRYFLAARCDAAFLRLALVAFPNIATVPETPGVAYELEPFKALLRRLHSLGLLVEDDRLSFVKAVQQNTLYGLDADAFVDSEVRALLRKEELASLRRQVAEELVPTLEETARDWIDGRSESDEPEGYFEPLSQLINILQREFAGEEAVVESLEVAEEAIRAAVEKAVDYSDRYEDYDWSNDDFYRPVQISERSIFDDIDE